MLTGVLRDLPSEVSNFEPELALDGGPDGLDVFRRLVPGAHAALKPDGFLAVELYEELARPAPHSPTAGFVHVDVASDPQRASARAGGLEDRKGVLIEELPLVEWLDESKAALLGRIGDRKPEVAIILGSSGPGRADERTPFTCI